MSNQEDKLLRSQRLHKSEAKQIKQLKIAQHAGTAEVSKHYYNKRRAMDCGNPQCPLCGNPRRTHKHTLTIQEQRFYQDIEDDDTPTS